VKDRRAILEISGELITSMFKKGIRQGYEVTENALPDDVKVVDVKLDHFGKDRLLLLLESQDFPKVENNKPYPVLPAVMIKTL
jgi:hypothetical protein